MGQKQQKKVPKLFLQDLFVDDYVCKLFSSLLTVLWRKSHGIVKVVRIPPLENWESNLMRIHPDVVEVFQSQLAF